jgi:hypothetical protein
MALSTSTPANMVSGQSHSVGDGMRAQLLDWSALSGDTSGTVTASGLRLIKAILVLGGRLIHSAAPSLATNVATLAFTVPAETAASQVKGGVTITAVANLGAAGNGITLTYTTGGTAGAEVVTVVDTDISVQIQSTVSTITQVRTAINASPAAAALVTATGTSGTAVSAATVTSCTGGVTGGGRGTLICYGI